MHNLLLIEDSRTVAVIYKEIITNKLSKIGIDVNIIIVESYEEWNMIKDTIKIDTVIADWNLKYSTSENILLECMDINKLKTSDMSLISGFVNPHGAPYDDELKSFLCKLDIRAYQKPVNTRSLFSICVRLEALREYRN
jgi:hypothetical protein